MFFGLLLLVSLASCTDDADTRTQQNTDSGARESIEPLVTFNDTPYLPNNSSAITAAH